MPNPYLDITEDTHDGHPRIRAVGELDLMTIAQLRDGLEAALGAAPDTIILDIAGVSFIDSAGLGLMLGTALKARNIGSRLVVRDPQPAVRRVIELKGIAETLHVTPQPGSAA